MKTRSLVVPPYADLDEKVLMQQACNSAAGLIDYYRGSKLVLVNKSVTSRDSQADLVISDSIGKVLGTVVE